MNRSPAFPPTLTRAIRRGDLEKVRSCATDLDVGQLNARRSDGRTVLSEALDAGDPRILRLLASLGADPSTRHTPGGRTLLAHASSARRPALVRALLEAGAPLPEDEQEASDLLFNTLRAGAHDILERLIALGINLDVRFSGVPGLPLALAARAGNIESFARLCSEVDIDACDPLGRRALHEAAASNNVEALRVLRRLGADFSVRDSSGRGALHHAVYGDGAEAVAYLARLGADPDARDSQGETPIFQGAYQGKPAAVRALLEHGADPNAVARAGARPLHFAGLMRHEPENCLSETGQCTHAVVAELLIGAGAALDTCDARGDSPLYQAAMANHPDVCRALSAHGAPLDQINSHGTALQACAERGSEHAARALLAAGADASVRSPDGLSLCEIARESGYRELACLLEAAARERRLATPAAPRRATPDAGPSL